MHQATPYIVYYRYGYLVTHKSYIFLLYWHKKISPQNIVEIKENLFFETPSSVRTWHDFLKMRAGYFCLDHSGCVWSCGGCQRIVRFGLLFFACERQYSIFFLQEQWHSLTEPRLPWGLVSSEWNWISQPLTLPDLFPDQTAFTSYSCHSV